MNADPDNLPGGFYVVAREPGAEHPALPTWGNTDANPAHLDNPPEESVTRQEIDQVPGAFQIHNLVSAEECRRLIDLAESCGFLPDAAVSLPRSVRHNDNMTWVADPETTDRLWARSAVVMNADNAQFNHKSAVGLNARFRFYRYSAGDYFKPHTDGAWPGSRIVDGELITNAYPDRFSQLSFILFLSDGYVGGETRFYVEPAKSSGGTRPGQRTRAADMQIVDVRTPLGSALCFPHGLHPAHCLHSSEPIISGTKYIIRSDVLVAT